MPLIRDRSRASPGLSGAAGCSASRSRRVPSSTNVQGTAAPFPVPSTSTDRHRDDVRPLWRRLAMLKLACQEQLLPGDDLQAKFDFARRAGFDGIELRAKGDGHFARRLPELRAAARDGVVM